MQHQFGKQLQCVIVTPEKSVFDEKVDFVALPIYDGELGVLPGRTAVIGRLGPGELRVKQNDAVRRFFVDGGFAQVRSDVVTVLTPKAVPVEEIDPQAAQQELAAAQAIVTKSQEEFTSRTHAEQRARAMLRLTQPKSHA